MVREPVERPWAGAAIAAVVVVLVIGAAEQLITGDAASAWSSAVLWGVAVFAFVGWAGRRRGRRR